MSIAKYENKNHGNYHQGILKLRGQMSDAMRSNALLRRTAKPTLVERVITTIRKGKDGSPLEIFLEQQQNLAMMLHTAVYLEQTSEKGAERLKEYKEGLSEEQRGYEAMLKDEDEYERDLGDEGLTALQGEVEDIDQKIEYLKTLRRSSRRIALGAKRLCRTLGLNYEFTLAVSEQKNLINYAVSTIPTVKGFIMNCQAILEHGMIELQALDQTYKILR